MNALQNIMTTVGPRLVFILRFLRSMKDVCMTKSINTLTKFIRLNIVMMVEKWKEALDRGGLGGALLANLTKAFDCIKHDFLIAKLAAYGFDSHSLSFVFSYLNERKQRTKIHNSYSPCAHIACGVPQGSILGPLLFNINVCDMFV